MRTLYISYDGMTDPLGRSQVIPYLAGLSKKGIKMSLLSFEKQDRFSTDGENIRAVLQEAGIDWHPLSYTKKPPVFSTIRDVRRMIQKAKKLHRENRYELVHCRSYIASLAGLHMKRLFGLKFLFDMRGFWADERVEGDLWNLKNPIYKAVYKYFKKKENQFIEQADGIISLTHAGAEEIRSRTDLSAVPPIEVIPCCVDLDLFDPERISDTQKEALRRDLGLHGTQRVLSYLGSVGTWYLLKEMLLLFKKIILKDSRYVFLFITPSNPETIRKAAEEVDVPTDKLIIREAKREEVPLFLSLSDYSVFFIKPVFSKKASSPTKQGEAMAMGIPVVCNAGIGDTDLILERYRSGLSVRGFSEEELERTAVALASQAGIFNFKEIQRGAEEYFSLTKGVEKYYSVYHRLGPKHHPNLGSSIDK